MKVAIDTAQHYIIGYNEKSKEWRFSLPCEGLIDYAVGTDFLKTIAQAHAPVYTKMYERITKEYEFIKGRNWQPWLIKEKSDGSKDLSKIEKQSQIPTFKEEDLLIACGYETMNITDYERVLNRIGNGEIKSKV